MKTFRCLEIVVALFLAAGGVWLLATRPLDDRLDAMLPQDPTLLQSMRILEDAKLSGRVIVHVQAVTSDFSHADFVDTLDRLADDLQSPMISQVVTPAATMPTPEDMRELAKYAPQLLGPETYADLERRLEPEGINQALAAIRRALMSPHSIPMTDWFRRDPLGARATALKPLEALGKATGFQMTISNGHFFSEDQQSAMLILETPVRVTDHAGSVRLMTHIRSALDRLPSGLDGSIIAGHLHTLSNQRLIRRDIGWTGTLASVFFGALFLIYYRDARALAIFLIPMLGILMGLAVVGLTGAHIAAVVLGMCSMLAGIAIDYAIHVYVALSHPETDRSREEAVRLIHRTLWLSALTTLIPIVTLTLSAIPGYKQLGLLAGAAILFSLLLAIRIMPLLFPKELKAVPARHMPGSSLHVAPPRRVLILFGVCLAGAIAVAAGIRVDLDFERLSGTEAEVLRDEELFFERWGTGPSGMGIVAVWDSDPEKARQANDAVYRRMTARDGMSNALVSLAPVSPSAKTRHANAARWLEFWDRRADEARAELARIGPDYGFAEHAFDPFFASLDDGTDPAVFAPDNRLLTMLEKQFIHTTHDRVILLSFYPDHPDTQRALATLDDLPAHHTLISRNRLQAAFASAILRDLARQAGIALVLIMILVTLLVRQARAILLIAVPPIAGAAGMLAGLRLLGRPLTPVTLLAGFLMAGNCFDYGVFMLQAWRSGNRDEIGRGVYLAWLTTAGAASLLLVAQHPVLYSTGLALALGVTCGYLTARWVLWSAARALRIPAAERRTP